MNNLKVNVKFNTIVWSFYSFFKKNILNNVKDLNYINVLQYLFVFIKSSLAVMYDL